MEFNEILDLIIQYASIFGPALVSIGGIIITAATQISKITTAAEAVKADRTLKDVKSQLDLVISENKDLVHTNKLLLDKLTSIQGYSDLKKGQ